MASIRKRGSNSYLIVVSRGYDYEGNRLKSVQKTVKPPKEYTRKQAEKWVKEQAILFEREVQHTPEPINRSITLAKYIEHGLGRKPRTKPYQKMTTCSVSLTANR